MQRTSILTSCFLVYVIINLPNCGQKSAKLSKQLLRIVNKVAPCVKLNVIFNTSFQTNVFSKLKTVILVLSKGILPYRTNYEYYQESYTGLATRRLQKRIGEHKKSEQSAIYNHSADTGHIIKVSEALSIFKCQLYETFCINVFPHKEQM